METATQATDAAAENKLYHLAEQIFQFAVDASQRGLTNLGEKMAPGASFLLRKVIHLYSRSVPPEKVIPILQNYIFRGSYADSDFHERILILETMPYLLMGEKAILNKVGEALGDHIKNSLAQKYGVDLSEPEAEKAPGLKEGNEGSKDMPENIHEGLPAGLKEQAAQLAGTPGSEGDQSEGQEEEEDDEEIIIIEEPDEFTAGVEQPAQTPEPEAPAEMSADAPPEPAGNDDARDEDEGEILVSIDFTNEFFPNASENAAPASEAYSEDEDQATEDFDLSAFVNQIWDKEPLSEKTTALDNALNNLSFDEWAVIIPRLAQNDAREFICGLSGSGGNTIALVMRYLQEEAALAEMIAASLSEQEFPEEYVAIAQDSLIAKIKEMANQT